MKRLGWRNYGPVSFLSKEEKIRRRASRHDFDHLVMRKGKALTDTQRHLAQRARAISNAEGKAQKTA